MIAMPSKYFASHRTSTGNASPLPRERGRGEASSKLCTRITIFLLLLSSSLHAQHLHYGKPASKWTEALPIGNAAMGAMIYGGVEEEVLQLNEATFWSGQPHEYARKEAYKHLPEIRRLLNEGKQKKAEALGEKYFMGMRFNEEGYAQNRATWKNNMLMAHHYADPQWNDSGWNEMHLPTLQGWEEVLGDGTDGSIWFRMKFFLPENMRGKNLVLDLGKIRDEDVTWVNGLNVGTTEGANTTRRYTVSKDILRPGENTLAIQVLNYHDKGGFTGRKGDDPFLYITGEKAGTDTVFISRKVKYKIQDEAPPLMPRYNADYLPFGYLHVQTSGNEAENYRRSLDISNATATVFYRKNEQDFSRTYFASAPAGMIVARYTGKFTREKPLRVFFSSPHKQNRLFRVNTNTIAIALQPRNGVLKGVSMLKVVSNGTLATSDSAITVTDADTVTFYLAASTSFISYNNVSGDPLTKCGNVLENSTKLGYDQLLEAHIRDYTDLYNRFSLRLGKSSREELFTDERIRKYDPVSDPALAALYVQYGRYLLIASSRPGSQPANLQGIWNDRLTPPWGSKYTTNINLQMNYWPAHLLNLKETVEPLHKMIAELAETGRGTAAEHYNAPGWVLHHNTDLWRGTAPVNAANHGIWPGGSAWLCRHLWEHFLFTRDTAFLRTKAYPVIRSAAAFYRHTLVKDPVSGFLISSPSNSPEQGGLVAGPAMDHQLIRELFRNCTAAATVLNTDAAFRKELSLLVPRIAPNKIGRFGQLQEWMQDKDDTTNKHRHVSHLWGVYPGTDIRSKDTDLMRAARQSLLYRGDDGTGWSLAWKVNLWARFRDGDHALKILNRLLEPAVAADGTERGGVYDNLFDAHPPFQIDGNFGGAAGVAEMLVQSQEEQIELLPALPKAFASGEVKGLCARGNFVLDMSWESSKLKQVKILSRNGGLCTIKYGEKTIQVQTRKGGVLSFNEKLEKI